MYSRHTTAVRTRVFQTNYVYYYTHAYKGMCKILECFITPKHEETKLLVKASSLHCGCV